MDSHSKISIVIVNWNAGRQLRECVDSVIDYGLSFVRQIVVVDNGSVDGSETAIEGLPKVILIRAGENLGFGKACNLGVSRTDGDYLLFLNPDARLFPNTLSVALDFMQSPASTGVGICGVKLLDEDGHVARSCARFPTVAGLMAHAVGLDRIFPGTGHFMTEWDHLESRQVDHVIGSFFLVRREVFEVLQGFDTLFFVYLEDLDFSFRAKMLGWNSYYLAETKAYHAGGGTSRQVKARRLFYSLRSRLLYAFKHFHPFGASLVLLVTLLLEPVSRTVLALAKRSPTVLRETWSAYALLYRWLPEWRQGKGGRRERAGADPL